MKNNNYNYKIKLKKINVEKYFDFNNEKKDYYNNYQNKGIIEYIKNVFRENILDINITNDILNITLTNNELIESINNEIREYYNNKEMHITRMFGSYILLQKINGELKAVEATPIPIKYCPLMIKLLKEVGGDYAEALIKSLESEDKEVQIKNMCKLIDEVVIKGGYFDTNRPLNSCEANVLFGASETMSSAFKNNLIDAAVILKVQ